MRAPSSEYQRAWRRRLDQIFEARDAAWDALEAALPPDEHTREELLYLAGETQNDLLEHYRDAIVEMIAAELPQHAEVIKATLERSHEELPWHWATD
jgi:hypothetical protein